MSFTDALSPVDCEVLRGNSGPARCHGGLLAIAAAAWLVTGCHGLGAGPAITGSGRLVTNSLDLAGFSRVTVGHAFQADIKQGPGYRVTVTVDDNLAEDVDVTKSGDTLRIRLKPDTQVRQATLKVSVALPELAGLNLSGATRTTITGFESATPLEIELSGASRLSGDIVCGGTRLEISGASRASLRGSTGTLKINASGASNVDFEKYVAEGATLRASGASQVTVNVHGELEADASGASTIRYVGDAVAVNVHTSGASSVKPK